MQSVGTATYSPDDNKLRLYPLHRLDAETYARVKAAGFKWAPKQELFVAPMWTPEREDLLIELCGEVEDEDKTLAERAEERAERFEDYSGKRANEAGHALAAVKELAGAIPMGQPILVGHHSEKRARKDAEKIENGMRKAASLWRTSQYWTTRAAGALYHAKYKELPSVRARRIKKIESDKRRVEKALQTNAASLKFWQEGATLRNRETGETRKLEICDANREEIKRFCGMLPHMDRAIVAVTHGTNKTYWTAFDVLRPEGERYRDCPSMTVSQCREAAIKGIADSNARCARWIEHYDNRLAYERAMLGEAGGLATDRTGPEKGGACKCWAAPRGGWAYIQKVNKVSVTILDNWGNGGGNFTRTIPFDKLSAVMSAAEVAEARESGRLVETDDKTGFYLKSTTPPTPEPEKPAGKRPQVEAELDELADSVRHMGSVQVVSAPQLFPTPTELAERVIELADIEPGSRVLEPSAGTGQLLRAIKANGTSCEIVAVEINPQLCGALEGMHLDRLICSDFLHCTADGLGTFDRVVMNPPFGNAQDIAHILHARSLLNEGGLLVAICANGPRQREKLQPIAREWIDLPPGSFASSGTSVNAAIVILDAD